MAFSNQVFDKLKFLHDLTVYPELCVKTSHTGITAVGLCEQRKLKTLTLYGLHEKS